MHTWIPSTWQAEAGALQALDQPGLYREILFQRKNESVVAVIYHHAQHRLFSLPLKKKKNLQKNPCSEIERLDMIQPTIR